MGVFRVLDSQPNRFRYDRWSEDRTIFTGEESLSDPDER